MASRRNHGVPRVTAELRRQGPVVNHKRVARVMREHSIAGHTRRTGRRSPTKADHKAAPSPDLIGRDFTAARPGTKAAGDISYIPTAEGRLCLASWPDLATHEIIGYSMADHHRAELLVDALDPAAALAHLEPGCVIQSNRGSEYTSGQLRYRTVELGHRAEHGPDRELLRQRRRGMLPGRPQRGDRHPLPAQPDRRPRRRLRLHRDLLQQTPPAQAHPLELPHTPRNPPALPAGPGPRGTTAPCPRSRGNVTRRTLPGSVTFLRTLPAGHRDAADSPSRPSSRSRVLLARST
ncbi:IS3 family transposase [Streptomyces sp. 35M1]|uniref:IS3 family transposase n=1 Tax=Streptomyces sp. 35M1 TaxID=3142978 RepID=UPI00399080B9